MSPMRIATSPVLLVLALTLGAGCAPQTASVVAGDYLTFLSSTDSISVVKGNIPLDNDAADGAWTTAERVDCREFDEDLSAADVEALRLENPLDICDGPDWPPTHETWLDTTGFYVLGQDLDPWRGEAIINSEGDLQVGFHHRLPGGEDMRFSFVIDPDFQPTACVQNEAGDGVELVDVDGNWLDAWSEGVTGRRYFLNGGAFMWDPEAAGDNTSGQDPRQWLLPIEWAAGYGVARVADDDMRIRTTRFARPETYLRAEAAELTGQRTIFSTDLLYCEEERDCDRVAENANAIAGNVSEEWQLVGMQNRDDLPRAEPVMHDNRWRGFSERDPASLSRWAELHYNWVRFDEDPAGIEPGDSASGEFFLTFDALDSSTRMLVRGSFEVKAFRRDTWSTDYIPLEIIERNGTELCGGQGSTLF